MPNGDDRDFWSDEEWGDYDGDLTPPGDDLEDAGQGEPTIQDILDSLGKNSEIDFLVNLKDIEDGSQIRADRFSTLEDAIYFLYEIGVGAISDIIELELNVYAVRIPDDTQ